MPLPLAAASVSAAQLARSEPALARVGPRSGPATRVVWTSTPAASKAALAAVRKRAAASNGAVTTAGWGKSNPRVTALIFTREMVALGLAHGVIILSRRPCCIFCAIQPSHPSPASRYLSVLAGGVHPSGRRKLQR